MAIGDLEDKIRRLEEEIRVLKEILAELKKYRETWLKRIGGARVVDVDVVEDYPGEMLYKIVLEKDGRKYVVEPSKSAEGHFYLKVEEAR